MTRADTVLVPLVTELNVPVVTPLGPVGTAGWVSVFPLPLAARLTVAPGTGFAKASRTVTLIVVKLDPVLAVMVPGAAATSVWLALGAAGSTVTVAVCAIAIPLMVAETVLTWATVELNEPVATPLALVRPGCERELPSPVAARMTVAPSMGLPDASRAVTVTVAALAPALAVITPGAAVTED